MLGPGAAPRKLAPQHHEFLTHLSVALHKHRAYPPGHPMRVESTKMLQGFLAGALRNRPMLRIGVAQHHLIIDDEASEVSQPVLRELAERLHRRQVGAIVLSQGVGVGELDAALERMNVDPRRTPVDGTTSSPEQVGKHVEILPVSYTNLVIAGDSAPAAGGATSVADLWAEIARLTASPQTGLGEGGAGELAEALRRFRGDTGKRAAVVGTLERFGRAAARESGPSGTLARRELRELLKGIPRKELSSLLGIDLARPDAIAQLTNASEWLALPALIDLVEAAAESSGQSVSHFLLRLLRKLGDRSPSAGENDVESESGVRETIQSLLQGWNLADPNPEVHTRLLEELSRRDRSGSTLAAGYAAESERVVLMALEVATGGPLVIQAADGMLGSGHLVAMLDLLDLPAPNAAADAIWTHLVSPETLRRVLLEEPIDQTACVRLLARVPLESAEGLLDSLTISESQSTRWLILTRLAELGPAVGGLLVDRLDQAPWYLKRNLLGLLADLPEVPQGFSAKRYADEVEPLLRLEALRLMLRSPQDREEAINRSLADPDDRLVRIGLEAGAEAGLPRASLPRLMKFLNDASRPAELRARGVALLVHFESPTVRQWLVARSLVRRGIFRRTRLAPKSPDLVAGLLVLATVFRGHPQAAEVLRRAAGSGDPDLVSAVEKGGAP